MKAKINVVEEIEKMADEAIEENIKSYDVYDNNGMYLNTKPNYYYQGYNHPDIYVIKSEKLMLLNFAKKLLEK